MNRKLNLLLEFLLHVISVSLSLESIILLDLSSVSFKVECLLGGGIELHYLSLLCLVRTYCLLCLRHHL